MSSSTNSQIYDIVIYHGPSCPDGIGSLYCAKYYLGKQTESMMCRAGTDPDGQFNGKRILFVDLCPSLSFIVKTCKVARKLTILDHHKSAEDLYLENEEILQSIDNLELEIDKTRSGCQITWDYFFPEIPRPWFIDYIGDRDLWAWKLSDSKEINVGLFENNLLDPTDFSKLDNLLIEPEIKKQQLADEGRIILRTQKRELDMAVSKAYKAEFKVEDRTYLVWLGGNISMSLRSELGNLLVNKKFSDGTDPDFAVIWFYEPKVNEWWISFRGGENSPDLSVIAKKFGGGGHISSSACTLSNGKKLLDLFRII